MRYVRHPRLLIALLIRLLIHSRPYWGPDQERDCERDQEQGQHQRTRLTPYGSSRLPLLSRQKTFCPA